jgi:hypothetical protein
VNGIHEPNLILKDNDIKYKIRLSYENTVNLLRQIRLDAEFLYSLGIMDYSLLVGVHNTEYEIAGAGTIIVNTGGLNGSNDKDGSGTVTPRLIRSGTKADLNKSLSGRRESNVTTGNNSSPIPPISTFSPPSSQHNSTATASHPLPPLEEKISELTIDGDDELEASLSSGKGKRPSASQGMELRSVSKTQLARPSSTPTNRLTNGANGNNNQNIRESTETMTLSESMSESELALAQKLEVFKVVGPDSYFIGIIDFQQKWNFNKKVFFFLVFFHFR